MPRTNNSVEGWHNALKTFIGQSHPNIFKFIAAIQKEQDLQEMNMAQMSASQDPEPQRKKYKTLNVRIKNIVEDYNCENKTSYMKRIAHNVIF